MPLIEHRVSCSRKCVEYGSNSSVFDSMAEWTSLYLGESKATNFFSRVVIEVCGAHSMERTEISACQRRGGPTKGLWNKWFILVLISPTGAVVVGNKCLSVGGINQRSLGWVMHFSANQSNRSSGGGGRECLLHFTACCGSPSPSSAKDCKNEHQ